MIQDEVTGEHRNSTDPFLLRVIGGGPTLDSITYFDADEIRRYNPGNG